MRTLNSRPSLERVYFHSLSVHTLADDYNRLANKTVKYIEINHHLVGGRVGKNGMMIQAKKVLRFFKGLERAVIGEDIHEPFLELTGSTLKRLISSY